ncbi:MAG: transketolase [Candidatus Babeliaceae bacterium]|nr:transketolase [Candidatus Babeliaceae bacterium]
MKPTYEYLEYIAYHIRRLSILATTKAGSGHPTSCLSAADILAVLFFDIIQPKDHFILSKGHAAPALYAVYHLLGCISEQELMTLREFGSPLEGHPTPRFPYAKIATGSLGQGLSVGIGQLLAERLNKNSAKCFVVMGDSETTEGSVWEAAELASYYQLANLVAIIDVNGLGQTTRTIDSLESYKKKFESFGWQALIVKGNDILELKNSLEKLTYSGKPTCIIAQTQKGYGVQSVQNKENFHGKAFKSDETLHILDELKNFFPGASSYALGGEVVNSSLCKIARKVKFEGIFFKTPEFIPGKAISTRKAFGKALEYAGSLTEKIVSLDAEVNNSTFADFFAKKYPERFFQSYIAEQNMIGMAAGLASEGFIPFSSTFAAFLTRAYDQLRMSAISRLPLRVVGSHCGVSVGQDGPSQMGLEDIALFRTLPDSVLLYPCDAVSTYRCVELMVNHHTSISYLRTTRGDTPLLYDDNVVFKIGGCHILKQSDQDYATIVTAGIPIFEALKACQTTPLTIIDCYSIKPLPIKQIIDAAKKTQNRIIIVEDHYPAGGLGEAVIAALAEHAAEITWNISHLAVSKPPMSGKPEELLAYEEINAEAILKTLKK